MIQFTYTLCQDTINKSLLHRHINCHLHTNWAAPWIKWVASSENVTSIYAQSENSNQSAHSLVRIFSAHFGKSRVQSFFVRTTKTLFRLRGCASWFEPSLGAHGIRYVFWHCGSNVSGVYANSEDQDQSAHPHSLIRVLRHTCPQILTNSIFVPLDVPEDWQLIGKQGTSWSVRRIWLYVACLDLSGPLLRVNN